MQRVDPVAITGMGLVTAAGGTLVKTLHTLASRREALPAPPPFATVYPFPVFACADEVLGNDPIPRHFRTAALALAAAREALAQAGLSGTGEHIGRRIGIAVGTSVGASLTFFDFYKAHTAGEAPPLAEIREYLAAAPAEALARALPCACPVLCVTNACSSGADAIGIGAGWIRSGLCDVALVGGADALSYVTYTGFSSLRLPSPSVCRPFDARRDGLTLGEGAGFMLLESATSRALRGVPALGFVAGYGTATDAHHVTAPHPDGRGLAVAVNQAFSQAGATWNEVAFINAHGTATTANDAAEAAFFAARCPQVPFISTKAATGHTLAAAGAVEAVIAAAHLAAGSLPPTPGFCEADPAMAVAPVSGATPITGRFALSQSLAFGGNNSVLLLAGGDA